MGNYMQTYFLSYICCWIISQITWCAHSNLHNPPNVFINLKKVGWKVIKVPWSWRTHTATSSETAINIAAETTWPTFLSADLSPRALMSMRAFLLPLICSVRSSGAKPPYPLAIETSCRPGEVLLSKDGADVQPCGSRLHFSLSQWGSFTQILFTMSVAQDNRIWPSALK